MQEGQIYGSGECADCDLCLMVAEEFELLANEIKHHYIYYWHLQKLHIHLEIFMLHLFRALSLY